MYRGGRITSRRHEQGAGEAGRHFLRHVTYRDLVGLAVRAEDIGQLPTVLPEFRHVDEDQLPSAYVLRDAHGRELDFHPLEFDADGNGRQPQLGGGRALWPREALGSTGTIGGREVRCTSPEFQVEAHLYEGHDDVDWAAIAGLCEKFALPLPADGRPGFVQERRVRNRFSD